MDSDAKKVLLNVVDGDAVDGVLAGGDFNVKGSSKSFDFDGVMDPQSEQKEVFNLVGKPVLKDVLAGYNGAILAYGQTGAGKTHSLLNAAGRTPAEAGLLPRTVAALFVYIGGDEAHVHTVQAAAFQIYNEQVDDLLVEDRSVGSNLNVKAGGEVHNLTWVTCKTPDELLKHFQTARQNVIYAETKMNKASSRSHSVFQIKVAKRARATESKGGAMKMQATMGKLTVVDLAGSERVKRSGVTGQNLKEAANINTSLLAFGNVVQALADKKKHIPFRDSKLTRVIEDSVGGNCKTSLLVCCSPSEESCSETLGTLEFASRAMRVETCASVNECVVMVDAAGLAADLAGEGIDEAVRAKAKEMAKLQNELKSKEDQASKEASKVKAQADQARAEDAKRLKEQKELVSHMKSQLERAGAEAEAEVVAMRTRVEELEAEVQDAREGHEAKTKVVELEEKMSSLQAELCKERMQRDSSVIELATQLQLSVEEKTAEAAMRMETEAKLGEVEAQLREVEHELETQRLALRDFQQQMEQAKQEEATKAEQAILSLQKRQEEEVHRLESKHSEEQERLRREQSGELRAAQEEQTKMLREKQKAWDLSLVEQEERKQRDMQELAEELDQRMEVALDAKDTEINVLNELGVNKDLTISSLHTQAEHLEVEVEEARNEARLAQEEFKAEVVRVWEVATKEQAEIQAQAERQMAELEQRHMEHTESLSQIASLKQKRQAGAFSVARYVLTMKMDQLEESMKDIQTRFEARESRGDDVRRIKQLETELKGAQKQQMQQMQLASQLKMQLDNRDSNDMVFGGSFGAENNLMGRKITSLSKNLATGKLEPLNPLKTPSRKQFVTSTGFRK